MLKSSLGSGVQVTEGDIKVPVLVLSDCNTSPFVESSTRSLCVRPIPADQARGSDYKEGLAGKARTGGDSEFSRQGNGR